MKHTSLISYTPILAVTVFVIASVFASCSVRGGYKSVLTDIDSLTEIDADSACSRLKALEKDMTGAPEDVRAYYNLLCVKADDKAYKKHKSDSVINEVVEYYESMGSEHMPEAYYYAGRVNCELGNNDKAIFFFHKALLGDSLDITDKLKSRIYAQIGYIYLRNSLFEESKKMQELAYFYCKQIGDTLGMRYCREDINIIDSLSHIYTVSQESRQELLLKIQQINEKAKIKTLSNKNSYLQSGVTRSKRAVWLICIVAVLAAIILSLIFYYHRMRKTAVTDNGSAELKQHPVSKRHFYDKEVSELITSHLKTNKVLKSADWDFIETRLLESFPDFKDKLYSLYNLSETEYHICLLIKAETAPSNMAKLMATGNSTISQSRLRMQQKVFKGMGTAKDWDNFILSL